MWKPNCFRHFRVSHDELYIGALNLGLLDFGPYNGTTNGSGAKKDFLLGTPPTRRLRLVFYDFLQKCAPMTFAACCKFSPRPFPEFQVQRRAFYSRIECFRPGIVLEESLKKRVFGGCLRGERKIAKPYLQLGRHHSSLFRPGIVIPAPRCGGLTCLLFTSDAADE